MNDIYSIQDETLTAIGEAIRKKTNTTELLTPIEMAEVIDAIPDPISIEPIILTGACSYGCAGAVASSYIKNFGNTISTAGLTDTDYMFHQSTLETIPFDINFDVSTYRRMGSMFNKCNNLKELPKIEYAYPEDMGSLCANCNNLRYIPEDYFDKWDFSRIHTYAYSGWSGMFMYCYSLRKVPTFLLNNMWSTATSSFYAGYASFSSCYALDEIDGLGVQNATITSNLFSQLISYNFYRIKRFTFATNEDGTPKTANWKGQTIDFSNNIGCFLYAGGADTSAWSESTRNSAINSSNITKYNSGITNDKLIYNAETYEALKNDEDAFCIMSRDDGPKYSRYNRISAVETIKSLPDCSTYIAANGGTNTIKFKGISGEWTDGGAINTMTAEEIAVATAKGWTVSFS